MMEWGVWECVCRLAEIQRLSFSWPWRLAGPAGKQGALIRTHVVGNLHFVP